MSKQQLYILGDAVDMPAEEIKIKVESNIFADADDIKTAHSYSVTLPRTAHNDALLTLAYLANAESDATHRYLDAALYIDGVPLFEGGRAVINSVDADGYKLNLYWGLLEVFADIQDEGLDLNELPLSAHWKENSMATWVTLSRTGDADATYGALTYDSGMSDAVYNKLDRDSAVLADKLPWWMPTIPATAMLNKICDVYGLSIDYSVKAYDRLALLAHPLVTLDTMGADETLRVVLQGTYYTVNSTKYICFSDHLVEESNMYFFANAIRRTSASSPSAGYFAVRDIVTDIHFVGSSDRQFKILIKGGLDDERSFISTLKDGRYVLDETLVDVSVKGGEPIITVRPAEFSPEYGWAADETPDIDIRCTLEVASITNIEIGDQWCYERNYPSVGIIDYIADLLAHIGGVLVGTVTRGNLRVVTLDEIATAHPLTLDSYGVEAIEFTLGDTAQRNIYTHKDNDDVAGVVVTGAAELISDDTTLERERTAYESNFKTLAGETSNFVALWETEKQNDGTYKATWSGRGDYIASNFFGTLWGGLVNFGNVLGQYYGTLAEVIRRPKVVTVAVRLSVLDLVALDLARAVYIPQLSRRYIIESVESDEGERYKLKLVQI